MSIKKKQLKTGIKYCFTLRYTDIYGDTKQYTSKGYDTKKEAEIEEAKFRIKAQENKISSSSITFKQVFEEYIEYRKKDIKAQSIKKVEIFLYFYILWSCYRDSNPGPPPYQGGALPTEP